MSTLRTVTKQRFVEALEESYFTAANYKVIYPDEDEIEIVITFIPKPEFQFSVTKLGQKLKTLASPGEYFLTEDTQFRDEIGECIFAVTEWTQRIEDEYRNSNPVVDEFEEFRRIIADRLYEHVLDEHVHFTREEADILREKIDGLTNKLAGNIEKTEVLERRLSEATSELEKLKSDLTDMPKGAWYRKASNKILSFIKAVSTSREGREFALEAAKKFLLPPP
ncbi:hypothetical protein [Methylomonas fluvii]|uniref:Uncharacterized protein n=1 Tax=Methylomonas fluvii TaxID=1854564 RepID=A0ABR9DFI5_9GAMM|nr:hypothetical protein [Methylomonas fluvii]MBD9361088.1 hypothetical protein [Methylomonas fluvii]CAD6873989.1 hypothetical protein [Methylomonas fluvii]